MKIMGLVHGSPEQAKPLVIGTSKVYVHTDIQEVQVKDEVTGETRTEYTYQEVQYEKDEYIQLMAEENAALGEQITDLQLALCDVYEMME